MNNKRFDKVYTDPKFKPIPKKVAKVQLDDQRFQAMFKDKKFTSSIGVDKYGRKVDIKNKRNIEMEKFYMQDDKKGHSKDKKTKKKDQAIVNEEEEDDIEKVLSEEQAEEEEEENSSDSSDTSQEFEDYLNQIKQAELAEADNGDEAQEEQEAIPTGEETKRLAVVNLDWDNFHALDLYILFNSFIEGKGKVTKVEIYPSEFGIKEQQNELENGPDKQIYKDYNNDEPELDDERDRGNYSNDEESFNQVELRKYELKKLKYYYAVITCDSIKTAGTLYNQCDGMEIERTQSFIDMRFIPDTLEFPYAPKETCDHCPHDMEYNPSFRTNTALQKTKVELSWDKTNPKRDELLSRAFHKEQFNQDDIQELLMSSESESEDLANKLNLNGDDNEEDDDEQAKQSGFNLLKKKRKAPKFKDGETIEIKFNKGFEGINKEVTESNKETKSNWEKFKDQKKNIRRQKKYEEKRHKEEINAERKGKSYTPKLKKAELELLVDKSIANKPFKYNPNDSRFSTQNDTSYAVDPTSTQYKKYKKAKHSSN